MKVDHHEKSIAEEKELDEDQNHNRDPMKLGENYRPYCHLQRLYLLKGVKKRDRFFDLQRKILR